MLGGLVGLGLVALAASQRPGWTVGPCRWMGPVRKCRLNDPSGAVNGWYPTNRAYRMARDLNSMRR